MGILRFFRNLRKRETNNSVSILSSLGCFNPKPNGITPSMCNEGMIKSIIAKERRDGNNLTADYLEDWLSVNKRRIM